MQTHWNRPCRAPQRGFTMTEMAITFAIAATLAALAVPSFQGIIATQRGRTYASALYATLSKTRSTAITLNANVTLQPKAGGWKTGWQIIDNNGNVLDDYTAASNINVPTAANPVTYTSSGRLSTAAPMIQINTVSGSQPIYQCVSVTPSGRPYMMAAQTC